VTVCGYPRDRAWIGDTLEDHSVTMFAFRRVQYRVMFAFIRLREMHLSYSGTGIPALVTALKCTDSCTPAVPCQNAPARNLVDC
jgi:hypothetical protein